MRALALLATLLLTTVPLHADTLGDGRSWPPDPSLYAAPGTEVAPGLKVGDMLDEKNADLAKDLLPPEILEHYKKGHYRNPIDSWPTGIIHRDKSFEEASEKNAGKYALDPDTGAIVEKATAKQPEYVYGFAFPKIEENDPQGGLKALWNQYHNWWNGGSYHFLSDIIWTSPDGVPPPPAPPICRARRRSRGARAIPSGATSNGRTCPRSAASVRSAPPTAPTASSAPISAPTTATSST
jgi:hypothetical protein